MLIDAHTHLDQYNINELQKAIKEINEEQIITIANSMNPLSYIKNKDISKKSHFIIPTFGIHPWEAYKYEKKLDSIEKFIYETPMIGEIGLDFYWVKGQKNYESQIKVLKFFLKRGKMQNKIVNLHTKGAEREIVDLLYEYKIEKAIIHWYSGEEYALKKMIDRGCYFTIGVEILSSNKIQNIAKMIPLNKILTETDGPEGEEWINGKRCMPTKINEILNYLGKIKGISKKYMESIILQNFNKLIYNKSCEFDI